MLVRILRYMRISRSLMIIIWPFLVIVVLLLWLSSESMNTLIAVRSYTEGEGLWSKGQKVAVLNLLRYSRSQSESDFEKYREAIAVPLGDTKARMEMALPNPDLAIVWEGLIQGRTHPDDIPHVIKLYRRFHNVSFMAEVIELWEQGDRQIEELLVAAQDLQVQVLNRATTAELQPVVERILEIDQRLTPLEDRFTKRLGDAARATQLLLLIVNLAAAGTLVPVGILLSQRMVRRREDTERALKLSEERFNLAVSGSNDGLWDWTFRTREVFYSPRFCQLLGYGKSEMGATVRDFTSRLHQEDRAPIAKAFNDHLNHGATFDVELRLQNKAGEYRWFRSRGRSVLDSEGKAIRMAGALTDVNDRKLQAAELAKEKERAQVTLASIADGVITTDVDGRVEYLNPLAERLTGRTLADSRGLPLQNILRMVDEKTHAIGPCSVQAVLREKRPVEIVAAMLLVRDDGIRTLVTQSAAPIRDRDGSVAGAVLVLHDATRERQYAATLSYQASHDALTGLINRAEFEKRLESALRTAEFGRRHALLYLDLDQFKVINDTCGHAAGDQMIREVSAQLAVKMRDGDTLARLGGDEFGMLLENCAPDHALRFADEIRQAITEIQYVWESRSFNFGASIGLVNIENDGFRLADVMSAADSACFMAKEKGRNRVQIYRSDDEEVTVRYDEMEWVSRLRKAIEDNRFVLYSQDIVALSHSRRNDTHCELLVRMIDEHGNLVTPMTFIPAAERYGLMSSIDRWVIQTAFAEIVKHQVISGSGPDVYSINLSGGSISDERFLDFVRDQVTASRIRPQSICFEITETVAIANFEKAKRFIEVFKEIGCRFSLDDFGAGMSSFGYLKQLPVDFLKIDGGFVKDMANDRIDCAMVEAINNVGHATGKQTIAEFVDSERVIGLLRQMGVDFAQGYAISKPRLFFAPKLRVAIASGKAASVGLEAEEARLRGSR